MSLLNRKNNFNKDHLQMLCNVVESQPKFKFWWDACVYLRIIRFKKKKNHFDLRLGKLFVIFSMSFQ